MKRKLTAMIMAVVLALTLNAVALADDSLTVTGSATVQLEPDMAVISLGVTATEDDVLTAQRAVNTTTAAIVEAMTGEALAIAPEDIATTEYYINERYDYDYEKNDSVMIGYEATATLSICVRDLNRAGEVIDAAMEAGANRLYGVEFMSSDQTAARDQALAKAVQDGMRKAQVIADAAGVVLPKLPAEIAEESASVSTASNQMFVYAEATAVDADDSTQLQSGMLSVTARVTLTYEIK